MVRRSECVGSFPPRRAIRSKHSAGFGYGRDRSESLQDPCTGVGQWPKFADQVDAFVDPVDPFRQQPNDRPFHIPQEGALHRQLLSFWQIGNIGQNGFDFIGTGIRSAFFVGAEPPVGRVTLTSVRDDCLVSRQSPRLCTWSAAIALPKLWAAP